MSERTHDTVGSWVICDRQTGSAVFETFRRCVAEAINTDRYEVVPIGEYLARINKSTTAA